MNYNTKSPDKLIINLVYICFWAILLSINSCWTNPEEYDFFEKSKQILDLAAKNYTHMAAKYSNTQLFPRSVNPDYTTKMVESTDWTSGFYPGILWYLYEYSGDSILYKEALEHTISLEKQKNNLSTHDLGFVMFNSYGHAINHLTDSLISEPLVTSAKSLTSRFNSSTGSIRSWDFGNWDFPVIIDNMMNLELLFWATKHTGDSLFYNIALQHALTSMKNHIRENGSAYHLVNYNPVTGEIISRETFQGLNENSRWARGQAWALYGFTVAYRETKNNEFLEQAKRSAANFMNELPADNIPFWDYDVSQAGEPRDASAAAIAASALIELAGLTGEKGETFFYEAEKILKSLCSEKYLSSDCKESNGFMVKHCTGDKPHKIEIDSPLIYADYYLIEALLRYRENYNKYAGI